MMQDAMAGWAWFVALRPSQWTKNMVVGAAVFFAWWDPNQALTPPDLLKALAAIGVFCLASSGVYLVNDLVDRPADRAHPLKRRRPIASGALAVRPAIMLAAGLLISAAWAAIRLAPAFGLVIMAYMALQAAYTLTLKQLPLVDVLVIAAGFVLRAIGGAVVVAVAISPWLLLCAFLLALFLALCKRRHEKCTANHIDKAPPSIHTRPALDSYDQLLMDQLIAVVSAATIVCYAIYTLAEPTVTKFQTHGLGFTIPFVIFGIFRYLDLVYRHDLGDRPEKILLTDRPLMIDILLYGLCATAVLALARAGG